MRSTLLALFLLLAGFGSILGQNDEADSLVAEIASAPRVRPQYTNIQLVDLSKRLLPIMENAGILEEAGGLDSELAGSVARAAEKMFDELRPVIFGLQLIRFVFEEEREAVAWAFYNYEAGHTADRIDELASLVRPWESQARTETLKAAFRDFFAVAQEAGSLLELP